MPQEEKEMNVSGTPPEEPAEQPEETVPAQEPEAGTGVPETPLTPGEQAALRTKIEKMEQSLADAKDALLRTAAEYENFRKRSAREHDAAFDNGLTFAVTTLLPVLDTLELAAAAPTTDEKYKKGVTLTLDKCREAFEKMGIVEIDALGKPFDPAFHAAVLQQPATDDAPSGTVTLVAQKGYLLHDKVVRHASVAVAE